MTWEDSLNDYKKLIRNVRPKELRIKLNQSVEQMMRAFGEEVAKHASPLAQALGKKEE